MHRVREAHAYLRRLVPVIAIVVSGCSTSQQGADTGAQDPWRDRGKPTLEGPKHQQFASDHTRTPPGEGDDTKTSYMLGSGRFIGEPPQTKPTVAEDVKDGAAFRYQLKAAA